MRPVESSAHRRTATPSFRRMPESRGSASAVSWVPACAGTTRYEGRANQCARLNRQHTVEPQPRHSGECRNPGTQPAPSTGSRRAPGRRAAGRANQCARLNRQHTAKPQPRHSGERRNPGLSQRRRLGPGVRRDDALRGESKPMRPIESSAHRRTATPSFRRTPESRTQPAPSTGSRRAPGRRAARGG